MFKFKGGVHPPENKFTSEMPVAALNEPQKVYLPIIQHIGAPSKPVVNKDDFVIEGKVIAEAGGHVSVPIHSTISGKVADIVEMMHPVVGRPVTTIVIENDGSNQKQKNKSYADYYRYSPKELLQVIKDSGIVGLGGATFPTHVKLSPPRDVEIERLIINGAECEPYLTSDDRMMREMGKEVIEGTKILMYILNATRTIVAVEDNKKEAINKIKQIVFNEPNIDLAVLHTRYPQGAEKQLIKTLLNREIPSGGLPFQVGTVVDNVATAYSICRAIKEGESLTSRVVTVSGKGINKPGNYKVKIGTLVRDLVEQCGGLKEDIEQVVMGGPMMGIALPSLDIPILKGTSGLLFLTKNETLDREYFDCFRCGKCIRACPMGLLPNMMSIYVEKNKMNYTEAYYPTDCIECGCCAYVCPAQRPIVQQVKLAKAEMAKKRK